MFMKTFYHTGNIGIEKMHCNYIVAFYHPGRISSRNRSFHSRRHGQKTMELLIFQYDRHILFHESHFGLQFKNQ